MYSSTLIVWATSRLSKFGWRVMSVDFSYVWFVQLHNARSLHNAAITNWSTRSFGQFATSMDRTVTQYSFARQRTFWKSTDAKGWSCYDTCDQDSNTLALQRPVAPLDGDCWALQLALARSRTCANILFFVYIRASLKARNHLLCCLYWKYCNGARPIALADAKRRLIQLAGAHASPLAAKLTDMQRRSLCDAGGQYRCMIAFHQSVAQHTCYTGHPL